MAGRTPRTLPDNLDPLVDTLANVVGILVIVIALIQIELGDALDRVIGLASDGAPEVASEEGPERDPFADRREALFARTDLDVEASLSLGEEVLATLEALPAAAFDADRSGAASETIESLAAALEAARREKAELDAHRASLEKVPERLVARIPDPQVMRGRESWILVRFGRIYPVDRELLFSEGSGAIQRILPDGGARALERKDYEAAALYLRKRSAGIAPFRWLLRTDEGIRVELSWATREGGIEPSRLGSDASWRAWLAARSTQNDFIRFHVWSDSFEAYLAARTAVEAAGFRAGWRGHEEGEELDLGLRFGPPEPERREVEVD